MDTCPVCGGIEFETEGYLNPCSNAGCKLNGPVTYHLNCGSQVRDYCINCGHIVYDSADDPIMWKEVVYMCDQCKREGIQPGHWACGNTFRVPVQP